MKAVAALLFALALILPTNAAAQQSNTTKRKTPSLSTDDVRYGASSKVVETPIDPLEIPSEGNSKAPVIDARAIMKNAFAKLASVASLRTSIKVSAGSAAATDMVIEVARPDRVHVINPQMEMVVIGSTAYLKVNGGEWQTTKIGSDQQQMNNLMINPADVIDRLFATPGLKLAARVVGKATLDSTATTVYEIFRLDDKNDDGTVRLWIGDSDKLPLKMEMSASKPAIKMSFRFSDFNSDFAINAPTIR